MMDIILYVAIFIMGSVFGSFFSLAVYRLPRKENITYVRSHCTTCNHKLNFLDLIPIWSYIFLGGKCRYCKDKIRSRYILLEIFSGLLFVLTAIILKINIFSEVTEFIRLMFIFLFMCVVFIEGGIDKENLKIHEGTILYGIVVGLGYGIFNLIQGMTFKYSLMGFLIIPLTIFLVNFVMVKYGRKEDIPIGFGDIEYIATIGLFMGFGMQTIAVVLGVIITALGIVVTRIKNKNIKKEVPFGYYLSISTAITLVMTPLLSNVAELINQTMLF